MNTENSLAFNCAEAALLWPSFAPYLRRRVCICVPALQLALPVLLHLQLRLDGHENSGAQASLERRCFVACMPSRSRKRQLEVQCLRKMVDGGVKYDIRALPAVLQRSPLTPRRIICAEHQAILGCAATVAWAAKPCPEL